MTTTRKTEVEAIRTLVNLHDPDTQPDEWRPEDHAAAEAAAHVLTGLLRREDRAMQARAASKRRQAAQQRPKRKPDPPELREGRKAVQERSGGLCEARIADVCEGQATQVHHRAGRIGKGAHDPELLLAVCGLGNATGCHGWIHQHPAESYEREFLVRRNGIRFDTEEEG